MITSETTNLVGLDLLGYTWYTSNMLTYLGKMNIIPKPELFGYFGWNTPIDPSFGVTAGKGRYNLPKYTLPETNIATENRPP